MHDLLGDAADLGLYHPRDPHTYPGLGHSQARAKFLSRHWISRSPGKIVPTPPSHALPMSFPNPSPRRPAPVAASAAAKAASPLPAPSLNSDDACHVTGLVLRLTLRFAHVTFRRAGPAGRLKIIVRVRKTSIFGFPL